ncbi:hypothetical protein GBAR_LOCUS1531 [Geodia barretti]|uniref:Uncharacterized protein n=1 Tax=Geodia barretti TaxID=519541 RepID=A0AA35QWR6_GEOBA|nr:hypothetical protein GBAR_LOCUS1531 [Geodia barretti]
MVYAHQTRGVTSVTNNDKRVGEDRLFIFSWPMAGWQLSTGGWRWSNCYCSGVTTRQTPGTPAVLLLSWTLHTEAMSRCCKASYSTTRVPWRRRTCREGEQSTTQPRQEITVTVPSHCSSERELALRL